MYFEKYVKGKLGQTLWIRNLQLSLYGVPLSLAYTYLKDSRCVPPSHLASCNKTQRCFVIDHVHPRRN